MIVEFYIQMQIKVKNQTCPYCVKFIRILLQARVLIDKIFSTAFI